MTQSTNAASAGAAAERWESTRRVLDASPTAFHAGEEIARRLREAGFTELAERERWQLQAGKSYFVRRDLGAVIAFRSGSGEPAETGAVIAGAHTDSPALKLKIESEKGVDGLVTMATEIYGGPILSTWLDRDLEIAGRASLRAGAGGGSRGGGGSGAAGGVESRLVRLEGLRAVIPNVAIHLNRKVNEGFEYNKQEHLRCILGRVDGEGDSDAAAGESASDAGAGYLRRQVAAELGVAAEDILGLDLFLADSAPAALLTRSGAPQLYASRHIDNLAGCSTTLDALLESEVTPWTQVAVFFDNEEIGSRSHAGAQSGFLDRILDRLVLASGGSHEDTFRLRARSFLLSNDGAHGAHPNFHDKYDAAYLPRLGGGPVLKSHAGLSYTSVAESTAWFRRACEEGGVPHQVYANRSDGRSGSTIGPLIQTRSDLRSVDVGLPMLAMHSVREIGDVTDLELMTRAIAGLYRLGPG